MIRVLLVDDEALVRGGLRAILESTEDIRVVGEADDGEGAVPAVRLHRPDVVLMDVRMPRVDGLEAARRVAALPNAPRVVMLTTFELDGYIVQALQNGAYGFLLKDVPPRDLIQAVRVVAAGEAMLSPTVTRKLLDHFSSLTSAARRQEAIGQLAGLTPREREVLAEVARGLSNADIGRTLFLSEATVKSHVSRVIGKLGVGNRVQVAMIARDAGLVG